MAVGDVVSVVPTSVSAAASLTIQPSSTAEWVIHNLYYGAAVEVYYTDGTNSIKIDSDASLGGRFGAVFHVTATKYLALKNVSAGAAYFAYDGVITHA